MTDHEALDRLRRALAAQADTVEVEARALEVIRDRIAARRRRWWHGLRSPGGLMISIGTVAAGAVAASLIAVTGLVSCGPPAPPGPADSPSATVAASPSASSREPEPTGSAPTPASLPVYFAGRTDMPGQRYRLYREFHSRTMTPDRLERTMEAVRIMLAGDAADPDYEGLWPRGVSLASGARSGDLVAVSLTGVGGFDRDRSLAPLAVQQLVWTVTAASGADRVRILVDGQPVARLWGIVDTSGDLRRGPTVDTLAPVWLIEPQHGATVGRTVQLHFSGYAHEGTVNYRVRTSAGAIVHENFVTLNKGAPEYGEARATVTLAPGGYVVEAYVVSMEDGREMHRDTHGITVT